MLSNKLSPADDLYRYAANLEPFMEELLHFAALFLLALAGALILFSLARSVADHSAQGFLGKSFRVRKVRVPSTRHKAAP